MARTFRARSRLEVTTGDYYQLSSFGETKFTHSRNYSSMINDYRGRPVVPSPLTSEQWEVEIRANGRVFKESGTVRGYRFENYPVNHNAGDAVSTAIPAVPPGWELSAIARSNPSRPVVNPPEIIENLVSLPKMLRNAYRALTHPRTVITPRGVSSEYLGIQFGWLPFIEDLNKILDLQKHVERRAKQIDELYKGKGLRRKITFSKDTRTYKTFAQFNTDWGNVKLPCSQTVTDEVWATVRWKPTGPMPPKLTDPGGYAYYRRVVLGLTPEGLAHGLWKVIPWTWLLGWFTNVGDLILVGSNTVPAVYTEACLMRKTTRKCIPGSPEFTGSPTDTSVSQGGSRTWTRRLRTVGTGNLIPSVNMPFLDMFRLSIVGALAAQRGLR